MKTGKEKVVQRQRLEASSMQGADASSWSKLSDRCTVLPLGSSGVAVITENTTSSLHGLALTSIYPFSALFPDEEAA